MATPVKSIRKDCVKCCLGSSQEVELCPATKCPSWPYRFGKRKVNPKPLLTPRKAIRAKCNDCSGFNRNDIAKCPFEDCDLYSHRTGHRPA